MKIFLIEVFSFVGLLGLAAAVAAVTLWVLVFKRAKLYIGFNIIPGIGPFIKRRVGTLKPGGEVLEAGLFGRRIGFIKDISSESVADVISRKGDVRGRVQPDGKVVPGGWAETPTDWRTRVYADGEEDPVGFVRETGRLKKHPGEVPLVAKGAGAILLLFADEYESAAQDIGEPISKWDLCFLTCLIAGFVFAFGSGALYGVIYDLRLISPALGPEISYLITAAAIWFVIWGALAMWRYHLAIGLHRLRDFPLFRGWLTPSRLNRSTGIRAIDTLGAILSLWASVLFFYSTFLLLPLGLCGLVGFLTLILKANSAPWPVHPRRKVPQPPVVPPIPRKDGEAEPSLATRSFRWQFRGLTVERDYSLDIAVRTEAVEKSRLKNPSLEHGGSGFASMQRAGEAARELVEDSDYGRSSYEVLQAVRFLLQESKREEMTVYEEANNVLQFVQNESIPYRLDEESQSPQVRGRKDYFRYPIETIFDQEGDCDCKAILAASIFAGMGFRPILMVSTEERHAVVAIEGAPSFPGSNFFRYQGKAYYWCEAAADRAFVGQVPPGMNPENYTKVEIR
ncbi:MAG: hypothetical protein KIT57_10465 [Blastocatellales bacterium]|nr:hypothetical protein [Blastocatellales bacterium]